MSNPFVGEVRLFAGNFAPAGWAFCDGSLQSIAENDVLFSLIGTTYGGDGQETFGLPDLRGRVPIHQGTGPGLSGHVIGEVAGSESVTLVAAQLASHSHALRASNAVGVAAPAGGVLAANTVNVYGTGAATVAMAAQAIAAAQGGSQPHDNMAPYVVVNYIISLFGIYPQQN